MPFTGSLLLLLGLTLYFSGILFAIVRIVFHLGEPFRQINQAIIWYSGMPFTVGLLLVCLDLGLFLPSKRRSSHRRDLEPVHDRHIVVALTAYNDEESIGDAVNDFRAHSLVTRVIVVDNNSRDRTADCARNAGARVVTEAESGYGRCVYRCFQETLLESDVTLIALCEGDMTFRARDLEKLVAYIDHAEIVSRARRGGVDIAA